MTAAHLTIIRAGNGTTIQDSGRFLLRRYGVTPSGPMDWTAYRTVQHALGNSNEAAALEIAVGGLEAVADAPLDLAFGGGGFIWARDGKPLPACARIRLQPGQTLAAKPGPWGAWTYLGVAGGFATPVEMRSRSTHVRSGIGGGIIQAGDRLPVTAVARSHGARDFRIDAPWLHRSPLPIRVLLGPQDDYFSAAAIASVFAEPFRLTASADRMAYRLEGPKIDHALGYNIVSDGIALGAIQIGGDGQLLVLMADHQPTGGYPKIGYVLRADIGRLAQMRLGEACHFAPTSMAAARTALFALEDKIAAMNCQGQPIAAGFSSEVLRSLNLVDGVVETRPES